MGKKNLDSILIKDVKVLPTKAEEKLLTGQIAKSKAKKEPDSEVISIKITASELGNLKGKKDPLVPMGTYIKHYLRTKTDLLIKQEPNE